MVLEPEASFDKKAASSYKESMNTPLFLLATLGYPGSGKTHFAERFCREHKIIHLNSDQLRHTMFANPKYTSDEHQAVFREMDRLCEEYISQGKSVLYDANNNRRDKRLILQHIAQNHEAQYVLLYFNTPLETAIRRNNERQHIEGEKKKLFPHIDEAVIHRMNKNIELPNGDEPFIEINGQADYAEQEKTVLAVLEQ